MRELRWGNGGGSVVAYYICRRYRYPVYGIGNRGELHRYLGGLAGHGREAKNYSGFGTTIGIKGGGNMDIGSVSEVYYASFCVSACLLACKRGLFT